METTIQLKSNAISNASSVSKVQSEAGWYGKMLNKLDFSYFGLISMTILVGSIVGGFAASCILSNNAPIWELCLCAAVSMANNVSGIGQAPTKWVANLFILSLVVNVILIFANIL